MMYNEKVKNELQSILKECVTIGTFWNRHFQEDDTIDIWRETNRMLIRHDEEAASFDTFYVALQQFKRTYMKDFEGAVEKFISTLEARREIALEEKPVRRHKGATRPARGRIEGRAATGRVKIKGGFSAVPEMLLS